MVYILCYLLSSNSWLSNSGRRRFYRICLRNTTPLSGILLINYSNNNNKKCAYLCILCRKAISGPYLVCWTSLNRRVTSVPIAVLYLFHLESHDVLVYCVNKMYLHKYIFVVEFFQFPINWSTTLHGQRVYALSTCYSTSVRAYNCFCLFSHSTS